MASRPSGCLSFTDKDGEEAATPPHLPSSHRPLRLSPTTAHYLAHAWSAMARSEWTLSKPVKILQRGASKLGPLVAPGTEGRSEGPGTCPNLSCPPPCHCVTLGKLLGISVLHLQ